jgi:uncharacterized protein YqgC (DUF456 family)
MMLIVMGYFVPQLPSISILHLKFFVFGKYVNFQDLSNTSLISVFVYF